MGVVAVDCASAAEKFGACSVQDCNDFLCFECVGAVAVDDLVAVSEDAVSVKEGETEKTGVKNRLEETGDGDLDELHFWAERDV